MMHVNPPEIYQEDTNGVPPALITDYVVNIYAIPYNRRHPDDPIGLARSYGVSMFGGGPKHPRRAVLKELYARWGQKNSAMITP